MTFVIENKFRRQLAVLFLFSLIILSAPLICLVGLTFFGLRKGLTLYKKWYRPEYGPFLGGASGIHLVDGAYSEKEACSIVSSYFKVEGHLTLEEVQKLVEVKVSEFQSQSPSPWFPELTMYLTTWMGFAILKQESNFRVEDHVKMLCNVLGEYQNKEVNLDTEEEVMAILTNLSKIPFSQGKAPWEILVHQQTRSEVADGSKRSILIWRFHHALMDGLSFLTLISQLAGVQSPFDAFSEKVEKKKKQKQKNSEVNIKCEEEVERSRSKQSGTNLIKTLFSAWSFPLVCAYDLCWTLMNSWDHNVWHQGRKWPKLRTRFHYLAFDPISMDRVKRIRKIQGNPRVFNIMATALAGSLSKYLVNHKLEVPKVIHCAETIPIPKRSTRLGNSLTSSFFPIPLGLNDRREMLEMIERDSQARRSSSYPLTVVGIFNFLGLLPESWKRVFNYIKIFSTMAASNLPTFDEQISICGKPVLTLNGVGTPPASTVGIFMPISGYNGDLIINLGMSEDLIDSLEDLREIHGYFQQEIRALEESHI